MSACPGLNCSLLAGFTESVSLVLSQRSQPQNLPAISTKSVFCNPYRYSLETPRLVKASTAAMEATQQSGDAVCFEEPMKLLFVEMGVGYDQHGQDVTAAAMRACRDAISSNSIPAFRRGTFPVTFFNCRCLSNLY
uniref:Uncharacterized protein MANES_16G037200 n=1 Tax=Rhizophora mucronata TaxID=61149 RepID=A0A2P2JSI9_RHIMU